MVWDAPVKVADLVVIYRRRVRRLLTSERELLGTDVVDRLVVSGRETVRLGAVTHPGWHFQLFLGEETNEVVSCLGVQQLLPSGA